jgi:2-haloacid dehalogenase
VALPKNLTFVSLEVYGTLIDWETGIYEAFQREAERMASRSIGTS